jgi:hypothetical protein
MQDEGRYCYGSPHFHKQLTRHSRPSLERCAPGWSLTGQALQLHLPSESGLHARSASSMIASRGCKYRVMHNTNVKPTQASRTQAAIARRLLNASRHTIHRGTCPPRAAHHGAGLHMDSMCQTCQPCNAIDVLCSDGGCMSLESLSMHCAADPQRTD